MNGLRTEDLAVGHAGHALLGNIRLSLQGGELVALLGRNGTGKTTLLRTIAGALPPVEGRVFWNDQLLHALPAEERARMVALVLSQAPRCGMLDVRTLVGFGRIPWTGRFGRMTPEDQRQVDRALNDAGITHLAHRWADELSDGERQRVMIARALAQDAPLLLLDEPLAHLDLVNRAQVMHLLQRLAHAGDRSIILSTHDLALALELCDTALLVQADGRVWHGTTHDAVGPIAAAFSDADLVFDPVTRGLVPRRK